MATRTNVTPSAARVREPQSDRGTDKGNQRELLAKFSPHLGQQYWQYEND